MSSITLINQTKETVYIALFKQPVRNPNLSTVAWRVGSPPPGGHQVIDVPSSYEVFARYPSDPANPGQLDCTTAKLPFDESTARFVINRDATLSQTFQGLTAGEVHTTNNFGRGVELTISLDGQPIYPPQVLWQGAVFMEDVRSTFYAAVIHEFTREGDRLVQEAISNQIAVQLDGTITVSGAGWGPGYSLRAV